MQNKCLRVNGRKITGLEHAELLALVRYEPETGKMFRRVTTSPKAKAGMEAGSVGYKGRIVLRVNAVRYYRSVLAWFYMTGDWPPEGMEVDHADNDKANDRWNNLRLATPSENQWNRPTNRNNTSGYKGVDYDKKKGKWRARLRKHGQDVHLGFFATREEAATAYAEGAEKHHGTFARSTGNERRWL